VLGPVKGRDMLEGLLKELLVALLEFPFMQHEHSGDDWRLFEECVAKCENRDIEISKLEGRVIGQELRRGGLQEEDLVQFIQDCFVSTYAKHIRVGVDLVDKLWHV